MPVASVSSLLKSAASRAQKVQDQQDAEVAYEYYLSPKSYDDFVGYANYLNDRLEKTTDPSKALTYAKTVNSAQTAYISNEIQRQTIDVLEGTSDNRAKYSAVTDLYYQAANSGNYDLAQSLRSQLDSLSVTIQNEDQARGAAGQALASQMATLRSNNLSDAVDTIKSYMGQLGDLQRTAGTDEFQKTIKSYAKELGLNANAGFFDIYANLAQSAVGLYDNAIAAESDPANIRKFEQARNDLATGDAFALPTTGGNTMKVSLQDIQNQADAARVGETVFRPVNTAQGLVYAKNEQTGTVWGRTEDGTYRQIPLYNPSAPTTSTVQKGTDKNGNPQYYSNAELLKNNGFNVVNGDSGLSFQNTGNLKGFYGSPFPTSQDVQVAVGPDGELQISNGADTYNLNFDAKGKYTGLTRYLPGAITQVNGTNARFNSGYLSTVDFSNFNSDPASIVGIIDPVLAEAYKTKIANFNLVNGTKLPYSPSSLLQTNLDSQSLERSAAARYIQPAAPAPVIQPAAQAPTVQGGAVNPFNLPPQPKLVVAPPKPTPNITIAPPPKLPTITVGKPIQTPNITVH